VASCLLACGLLAALAFPTAAPAARGLVTGFQDDEPQSTDPGERALWLNRVVDSGAGALRFTISWSSFVGPQRPPDPTNPGSASYNFSSIDAGVRDARARGLTVLLNVVVPAPAWAEAPGRPATVREGSWKPNPSDLADFIQALAARYSGSFDPDGASGPAPPLPAAQAVEVWNETNYEYWLAPQFQGKTPVGPDHFRAMLNAVYPAVKAVNPQMLVVTGGTAPYGDPPGGPYQAIGPRVRPVEFWQDLLCVRPTKGKKKKGKKGKKAKAAPGRFVATQGCPGRTLFDVFAHHPISNTGNGPLESAPHRNDASTPDLGRVVRVLRGAERVGTVSGRHPVWVTEFWWDSNPPNPSGAPLGVQARWIEQSLYLFWKAGASLAINFQINDNLTVNPDSRSGYQAGIFFSDGRPKPALTAFRFPFVTERINKQLLRAWGKAPAAGKLVIQRKQGGRWVTIRKLQVGKGSVFLAKLRLQGKQLLRAQVAGEQSLVWKQAASATSSSGGGGGGPSNKKMAGVAAAGILCVMFVAAVLRRRQVVRRRRRRRELRRQRRLRPMTG
jgi:hypothetical protein